MRKYLAFFVAFRQAIAYIYFLILLFGWCWRGCLKLTFVTFTGAGGGRGGATSLISTFTAGGGGGGANFLSFFVMPCGSSATITGAVNFGGGGGALCKAGFEGLIFWGFISWAFPKPAIAINAIVEAIILIFMCIVFA